MLHDVLRRADTGINIGYAVIYECVRTITTIYPNLQLLEAAANHISRFVSSDNHNLKYLGIKALAQIVQVNQKYALDHQLLVVECMDDPDETLKRKTLELLFRMTNATNVLFVVDKLISHLRTTTDVQFRAGLTEKITQLAERYAPDNAWYIQTMNAVLELGGELVRVDLAHNLMRLIAEGSGEDEEADMAMRVFASQTYFQLLQQAKLPDILMQVICWVLGEYGYLCTQGVNTVLERLADTVERQFTHTNTRCWVLVAITKLVAQQGAVPEQVADIVAKYQKSNNVLLAKYCHEFAALAQNIPIMQAALPVDASCEDLEVDPKLGFLDSFVAQALSQGAQPYLAPNERPEELDVNSSQRGTAAPGHALRFNEYERPQEPQRMATSLGAGMAGGEGAVSACSYEVQGSSLGGLSSGSGLNTAGIAKKWGCDGFSASGRAPEPTKPSSTSSHASQSAPTYMSTSTPANQLAPAPPAPSLQPRELSEKEKMAAALFGGISGALAPPATRPVSAPGLKRTMSPPAQAPAPPPAPQPLPPVPAVDLLGDLLDVISGSAGVGATPPAPPPKPPASIGDALLSLLDGPALSSSPVGATAITPVAVAAPPPAVGTGMLPPMVSLGAAAPTQPGAIALTVPTKPATMGSVLASDSNLQISAMTVHSPAATELRLSLCSISQSALHNVSVQIEPPPTIKLAVSGPSTAEVRGTRVTLPVLQGGSSGMLGATLSAQGAAAAAEQQLLGQLTYVEALSHESRVLSFRLPQSARDLLRPHTIATSQFGELWPSHAAERKTVAYSPHSGSPTVWNQLLTSRMHLAHVRRFRPI